MADGKFKVEVQGMAPLFTDCSMVAYHTARALQVRDPTASVWEKDHSGWEKLYPPTMAFSPTGPNSTCM